MYRVDLIYVRGSVLPRSGISVITHTHMHTVFKLDSLHTD